MIQGGSYLGFGGWALLRREHYVRVHELGNDAWVLNAHAGWMAVVGTALMQAALRDKVDDTVRLLGIGAATSLAINDAAMLNQVAPVYRKDLAFESVLAALWMLSR